MSDPLRVDFYSRPGCHLCDEAKEVVERVRKQYPFILNVIDVESDPLLESAYGSEIPVVVINGIKAFKFRVDATEFENKVKRLWNR